MVISFSRGALFLMQHQGNQHLDGLSFIDGLNVLFGMTYPTDAGYVMYCAYSFFLFIFKGVNPFGISKILFGHSDHNGA